MACLWVVLAVFTITAFSRGLILNAKAEDVLEDERRKAEERYMV